MRRLVFITGVATVALICASCINFGPPLTGSIGTGPAVDTGPIATADVDLRDGSGGSPRQSSRGTTASCGGCSAACTTSASSPADR
jgi:hypothetical protein